MPSAPTRAIRAFSLSLALISTSVIGQTLVPSLEFERNKEGGPRTLATGGSAVSSHQSVSNLVAVTQTIDLVCEGNLRTEAIIIGKGPLEPKTYRRSRNYYFLDGRLVNASGYSKPNLVDFECSWSKGEINCNHETSPKACFDAFLEGVIRPELSFCSDSIAINRYRGTIKEALHTYAEYAELGRVIYQRVFEGTCESAPKQKF